MLRKQTVFVLGAGASVGYGLPTGRQLLEKARNLSEQRLIEVAGPSLSGEELSSAPRLYSALRHSLDESIDAVLELRTDITLLGKRIIAYLMLQEEQALLNAPHQTTDDWISYMFREFTRDAPTIAHFFANSFMFVTFNYDRVLEYKLVNGLAERYGRGLDFVSTMRKLQARIIHLHGDLGNLAELNPDDATPIGGMINSADHGVQFEPVCVPLAARRIRIVPEAESSTNEFVRALDALSTARQICFLGFGFGERNVERLRVRDWPERVSVLSTCRGMTGPEQHFMATEPFRLASRKVRLVDMEIRQFFREHLGIFRDQIA